MTTMRADFVRPLPDERPVDVSDRNWAITVAYVNDDAATYESVGLEFGISRARVRQIVMRSSQFCRRYAQHLVPPSKPMWDDN